MRSRTRIRAEWETGDNAPNVGALAAVVARALRPEFCRARQELNEALVAADELLREPSKKPDDTERRREIQQLETRLAVLRSTLDD